ncbi:MAG TPA: hypothetical protein VGD21_03645 [Lysobacter sp.]
MRTTDGRKANHPLSWRVVFLFLALSYVKAEFGVALESCLEALSFCRSRGTTSDDYRQTRRAARTDARRFSTRPWMACRKIPAPLTDASGGVSRQAFSLVTFFGQAKKVTRRKAEAFDLAFL